MRCAGSRAAHVLRHAPCVFPGTCRLPGTAQHLVHFACVQFLGLNHLPRIFFERDRAVFHEPQQIAIKVQRDFLCLQRFAKNRRDIERMIVQQRAYFQRWIRAERGDPFARLMRVHQRFIRLCAQP